MPGSTLWQEPRDGSRCWQVAQVNWRTTLGTKQERLALHNVHYRRIGEQPEEAVMRGFVRVTEVGEFVGVSGPGLLSRLTETRQVT